MNAAARLVGHSGRLTTVSGLLRDRLHWLRVPERVRYELCLLFPRLFVAPHRNELYRSNAENSARSRVSTALEYQLW